MNLKKMTVGTIKAGLWSTVGYGIYAGGQVVKEVGKEMLRVPPLAFAGLIVMVVGDVVSTAAVVPGVCVLTNTIDVVRGATEPKHKPEDNGPAQKN